MYNKLAPLPKTALDIILFNKNFANKDIANMNDPFQKRFADYMGYFLKNAMTPIMLQQATHEEKNPNTHIGKLEQMLGNRHQPEFIEDRPQYLHRIEKESKKGAKAAAKFQQRTGYEEGGTVGSNEGIPTDVTAPENQGATVGGYAASGGNISSTPFSMTDEGGPARVDNPHFSTDPEGQAYQETDRLTQQKINQVGAHADWSKFNPAPSQNIEYQHEQGIMEKAGNWITEHITGPLAMESRARNVDPNDPMTRQLLGNDKGYALGGVVGGIPAAGMGASAPSAPSALSAGMQGPPPVSTYSSVSSGSSDTSYQSSDGSGSSSSQSSGSDTGQTAPLVVTANSAKATANQQHALDTGHLAPWQVQAMQQQEEVASQSNVDSSTQTNS
jgi:hypothetical protein